MKVVMIIKVDFVLMNIREKFIENFGFKEDEFFFDGNLVY